MLVQHVSLYAFKILMKGQGYDKDLLSYIYQDIKKHSCEFNIKKIKKEYKIQNVIHPKDEREYKEFLDNKELGLRLFDEIIGGFIPKDITPDDILVGNINQVIYRIRGGKNEKDGKK